MGRTKRGEHREESHLLRELLSQPLQTLEALSSQLERQLQLRRQLSDEVLSCIGTEQLRLQQRVDRFAYSTPAEPPFVLKRDAERQLFELERRKSEELLACFHDVIQLENKLLDTQSQLARERAKLKLFPVEPERNPSLRR